MFARPDVGYRAGIPQRGLRAACGPRKLPVNRQYSSSLGTQDADRERRYKRFSTECRLITN